MRVCMCAYAAGIHVKGRGVRTVENALPLLLQQPQTPIPEMAAGAIPPRAVHRLDARVGGVLLVAKTREAETRLAAQFETHQVLKQYRAIVTGRMELAQLQLQLFAADSHSGIPLPVLAPLTSERGDVRVVDALVGGKRSWSAVRVSAYTKRYEMGWVTR